MPRASTQNARPALRRLPTRPSRMVQAVVSRLLPLLFRSQGLELSHRDAAEALAKAFAAQQSGGCNLLIAFRHPSTRDPVVMADLSGTAFPLQHGGSSCSCHDPSSCGFSTTVAFRSGLAR